MRLFVIMALIVTASILAVPAGHAAMFEVYLEGFTDNPATANIGTVAMVVEVDGSGGWVLNSEGIGGACSGWFEGTGSGFINGPSINMSAYDRHAADYRDRVDYSLQDGRLFWIDCTAPVTGLRQIVFWNAPDIGDYGMSQYPDLVQLVELSASRAVFSASAVPTASSTWGRIKSLYR